MDGDFAVSDDDLLIAVIGATGSGKSTFISALLGEDIGIGHSLISATTTCSLYKFLRPGGSAVYLIDTPGFNDTTLEESEVLRNIAFMLTRTYKRRIRLSGIIYTHRITDVRVGGSGMRMMKLIRNICGEEAFSRVVLATTMWQDLINDHTAYGQAVEHERELQSKEYFWGAMCDGGSKLMRWNGSHGSATAVVDHLSQLQAQKGKVTLQIQKEIVDWGQRLNNTQAGRTVSNRINELTGKLRANMSNADPTISEEQEWHRNSHIGELKTVINELMQQISEAKKAQDALNVNYDILSQQKTREYEELLRQINQRARDEHEAAQVQRKEPLRNDPSSLNELEYNKYRLSRLDERIKRLESQPPTLELKQVQEERQWVNECYQEFCTQYNQDSVSIESSSQRHESTRLDKVQVALQGFGFLAGLGLTIAGVVTMFPPMIASGVAIASSSMGSLANTRDRK